MKHIIIIILSLFLSISLSYGDNIPENRDRSPITNYRVADMMFVCKSNKCGYKNWKHVSFDKYMRKYSWRGAKKLYKRKVIKRSKRRK